MSREALREPARPLSTARTIARAALGAMLLFTGISHLTFARREFLAQVPKSLPLSDDTVVIVSGVAELLIGATLIALPKQRIPPAWAPPRSSWPLSRQRRAVSQRRGRLRPRHRRQALRAAVLPALLVAWALHSTGAWEWLRDQNADFAAGVRSTSSRHFAPRVGRQHSCSSAAAHSPMCRMVQSVGRVASPCVGWWITRNLNWSEYGHEHPAHHCRRDSASRRRRVLLPGTPLAQPGRDIAVVLWVDAAGRDGPGAPTGHRRLPAPRHHRAEAQRPSSDSAEEGGRSACRRVPGLRCGAPTLSGPPRAGRS